jgi:hypothetical protein
MCIGNNRTRPNLRNQEMDKGVPRARAAAAGRAGRAGVASVASGRGVVVLIFSTH